MEKKILFFKGRNSIIGLVGGDTSGWIQDKINPPEMHLPGLNCDLFTKLEKKNKNR